MEVIGTTDVGVGDCRLLRGAGAGPAVQPILQNGLDRRIGPRVDFERPFASRIKPVPTELVGQSDHAQTGAIALFGVLALAHYDLSEDRDVRPDTRGPGLDALRCPVLAEPVVRGHVVALRGMLPVAGGANMGGDALPDMEDFNRPGGDARP